MEPALASSPEPLPSDEGPPRRGGRPSSLTPAVEARLCELIAGGITLEVAARYVGISPEDAPSVASARAHEGAFPRLPPRRLPRARPGRDPGCPRRQQGRREGLARRRLDARAPLATALGPHVPRARAGRDRRGVAREDCRPHSRVPQSRARSRFTSTTYGDQRMSLLVQRVPIASLAPDPSNARTHPEANLDAIISSLRRFGQAEPLVVQSGTRRVIAGHGRLMAMQKLGWTECDVVELEVSSLDATALAIALNRSAELAQWDDGVLARLLSELRAENAVDGVGFGDEDIDRLLAEVADAAMGEVDEDVPPEPMDDPVTRREGPLASRRPPAALRGFLPPARTSSASSAGRASSS